MHPKIIDIVTADVSRLFDLDEAALFNLKLEYGLRYLDDRFANDPHLKKALSSHAEFWLWWRQLWAERDRELLKRCSAKSYGIELVTESDYSSYGGKMAMVKPILHSQVWEFYEDFNYWSRVKLYPNNVLISACEQRTAVEATN
jgi:hypothetical protein